METYLHKGIRILYNSKLSSQFNMHKAHFHDEYELYYLINGSRQLYINENVYPLYKGSLAFIDGEDMHRTFSEKNEPVTRFVVCINKSKLQKEFAELTKPFSTSGAISLNLDQQKEIEKVIDIIKKECEEGAFLHHESIYALVMKLFIDASRLYREPSRIENSCSDLVLSIINFINSHYSDKFTLEDISKNCNISVSHITRLFKASTGYSIVDYTNNLRMKKAAEFIKNTKLSISEIALKTGFSSFSYFGKMFSEYYGISPLKYRKTN